MMRTGDADSGSVTKPFFSFLFVLLLISACPVFSADYTLIEDAAYAPGDPEAQAATHDEAAAFRSRPVALTPVIANPDTLVAGDTLSLNLFDDTVFTAVVERVNQNVNGTVTIRARIEGYDFAYAFMCTTKGRTLGMISIPQTGERYKIMAGTDSDIHVLYDEDPAAAVSYEDAPAVIPSAPEAGPDDIQSDVILPAGGPLDPAAIDVMVVYTPAAASWASGEGGIANIIAQAMAKAQLALDNSLTYITMNLVHTAQVSYTEDNYSDDLDRLTYTSDGYMDNVHTLRTQYGADIVTLYEDEPGTGGVGWLLSNTSGRADRAFNIVRIQQASWTYTHIHEMAHNMGCHHHKYQNVQPGPGLYSYAAGWRWTGNDSGHYCSVMTYESGSYFSDGIDHERVAYFSNPSITYQGVATGHTTDGDNARALRTIKHVIAAYKASTVTQPDLQVTGDSYTPGIYNPGDTIPIEGTVYNNSSVSIPASSSFRIEARLSRDLTWGNADDYVVNSWIEDEGMDPWESYPANEVLMIPGNTEPGTYYIAVKIDADGDISESNESNNTWWSASADIVIEEANTITIGTGTGSWEYPLASYYHDARTQTIYLSSELGGATTLNSLSLYVTDLPGQILNNFTIRIKHTTLSSYTSPAWESAGWTTVYQAAQDISATGWVRFPFSTPFAYNGTQNILVDISFNNTSYSHDGECRYTNSGSTRSIYSRTDSIYGDPLTWSGTSSPPPSTSTNIPNIKLGTSSSGIEVLIGSGTGSWEYPFYTFYHDARTQTIYLASEIGGACSIQSLGLDVTTLPDQTLNNFTIRMKHTNLSTYSIFSWESTDWTTVYQADESITETGWVMFNFTTPFAFNGTQNLLVDISFNNTFYSSNGYCTYSAPGGTRSIYYRTDSNYGDPLTWSGTYPGPSASGNVPNLKLMVTLPDPVNPDLNLDGDVNFGDYCVLSSLWLEDTCNGPDWCQGADFNQSGGVNLDDLKYILDEWLTGVSAPADASGAAQNPVSIVLSK